MQTARRSLPIYILHNLRRVGKGRNIIWVLKQPHTIYSVVEDLLCYNTLSLVSYLLLWRKQLSRLTRYPSCPQYTTLINATTASTSTTTVSAPGRIRKSTALSVVSPAPHPLPRTPPCAPWRTPPCTPPWALPHTGDEFRASWTSTQIVLMMSRLTSIWNSESRPPSWTKK